MSFDIIFDNSLFLSEQLHGESGYCNYHILVFKPGVKSHAGNQHWMFTCTYYTFDSSIIGTLACFLLN